MILIFASIIGIICMIAARQKGRSMVGWFFIGFMLGLIGLVMILVVSNKKEQKAKEEYLELERRRLEEQLQQERIKNEQFRKHAQARLDVHDEALEMDTHQLQPDPQPLRLAAQSPAETLGAQPPQGQFPQEDWYYRDRDETKGPLSFDHLRRQIESGTIGPDTYLWHSVLTQWRKAREVEYLDFGDRLP